MAEWIEDGCETSIVGDIVIWLHGADAHIGTLAVRPGYCRLGIGRKLLKYGLIFCLQEGIKSVSLEVRESNLAAQRLYQSMGFSEAGWKENYYEDSHEDAIVMDLLLLNENQLADLANNG